MPLNEYGLIETTDRRFNPEGNQNYDIKHMWASHHEIKRLVLLGMNNMNIARLLNCTYQTVSNVRNNPIVLRELEEMEKQRDTEAITIGERIMKQVPLAVRVLEKSMQAAETAGDDQTQLRGIGVRSATTILDHAHPKTTKTVGLQAFMSLDRIREIQEKVKQRKLHPEEVGEAEVVTVVEEETIS